MENTYDSIPYPSFSISEYVTRKTKDFCKYTFYNSSSFSATLNIKQIQTELYKYRAEKDRVQFIVYVISHIKDIVKEHVLKCTRGGCTVEHDSEEILYFLYSELNNEGIPTDVEALNSEEEQHISSKIDEILRKLEEVQAGNAVLFERIEELKGDFKEVISTMPLGKKNTVQRILGITTSYLGEKGADEVFNAIFPLIKEAINNSLPHLLG